MKPILLYAMHRSRSTAILHSAKRSIHFHEPFNRHRMKKLHGIFALPECQKVMSDFYYRDFLLPQLQQHDLAIKILGIECRWFSEARQWLTEVQENNKHEIYIVVRDLREIVWSTLLAMHYGYFHGENWKSSKQTCEITPEQIRVLTIFLDSFLEYLPSDGQLISWDHLPTRDFDKEKNTIKNQYSLTKLPLIQNYQWCNDHVEEILKIYQPQWEDKVLTKPWASL